MPLATLLERMFAPVSQRRVRRLHSKRNPLRFEVCEPRCTPALLLNVGTHDLLPNTPDQRIDIFLQSTDPVNDPEIEFMNLVAEIGDAPHLGGAGFDPYPNFQAPDFTGGIWDEFPFSAQDLTGQSSPFHAEGNVIFDSSAHSVAPNGKVVTLVVDTTGFTSGEFPLKLKDVGAQFSQNLARTDFGYIAFDAGSQSNLPVDAPVTITNGTIRIAVTGSAPTVDLNGNTSGTGFNAYFTQNENPSPLVGTSGSSAAVITDADSSTLSSATITLSGTQNGASEVLAVNTTGTPINADYNAAAHTLTLSGSASLANYQQVLRTLTYSNTAADVTPGVRTASITVNDGTTASTAVQSSVTVYDLSFPWHNQAAPTNVDNSTSGTTINDALLIVSNLRTLGTRQLAPTAPAGNVNYVDVDRNNRVTINDALVVVSQLRNQLESEGEMTLAEIAAADQPSANPRPVVLCESDLPAEAEDDLYDDELHDSALWALLAEQE